MTFDPEVKVTWLRMRIANAELAYCLDGSKQMIVSVQYAMISHIQIYNLLQWLTYVFQ